MELKLDKNNPIPVGVQVKEQIKMLVNSGAYHQGDKLPSIMQLASLLQVNKNTIVSVLKDLENEGYVESFRGKGVFISSKKADKNYDSNFIEKVDTLIREANKKKIGVNELINFISARFNHTASVKSAKILFLMGISQELVDINVQKLKQNLPGFELDGLLFNKELKSQKMKAAFAWADLITVPAIIYDHIKVYLPTDKPVIKTMANLRLLSSLKKGIEKKSKVAVIGVTQNGAQALAEMFVSARLFRPKLVLPLNDLDKYKKELKEMDSFVICISAREAVERLKIKDRDVYFFSDYIDQDSIEEIKIQLKRL